MTYVTTEKEDAADEVANALKYYAEGSCVALQSDEDRLIALAYEIENAARGLAWKKEAKETQ